MKPYVIYPRRREYEFSRHHQFVVVYKKHQEEYRFGDLVLQPSNVVGRCHLFGGGWKHALKLWWFLMQASAIGDFCEINL